MVALRASRLVCDAIRRITSTMPEMRSDISLSEEIWPRIWNITFRAESSLKEASDITSTRPRTEPETCSTRAIPSATRSATALVSAPPAPAAPVPTAPVLTAPAPMAAVPTAAGRTTPAGSVPAPLAPAAIEISTDCGSSDPPAA